MPCASDAFSAANEGRPVFVIVMHLNIMSFASLMGSGGLRLVTLGDQITLCGPLKYQNIQCQCLYPISHHRIAAICVVLNQI